MRRAAAVAAGSALTLLALLGAGCRGDTEGQDEAEEPSGPARLEVADVFPHDGYPDWLLEAFGSLWALTDDGHVLHLDPGTGALLATHDIGYHALPACNGLGHDSGALWTCSGPDHLARIDPETGDVTRVRAAKRSDEGRLAFSGGLLWHIRSGTTDLVGLDEAGETAATVPLGMVCTDLAYNEATVWVVCPTDGVVVKVDASSSTVVGTVPVDDPRQAVVGEDLFVGSGDGMVQVDVETLEVEHTYIDVGPGQFGAIDATAEEVWVRREGAPFLTAVDPGTHEVVATVEAPDYPSGGDVVITEDWIWATAYDDGVVVRVAR